jgi:predicted outer membrane lipoprotein
VQLAGAFGIINVMWMESAVMLGTDKDGRDRPPASRTASTFPCRMRDHRPAVR